MSAVEVFPNSFSRVSLKSLKSSIHDSLETLGSSTSARLFGTIRCPANCPSDPYVQPGMLYFGKSVRDTRWTPFPVAEISGAAGQEGKMLKEMEQLDDNEVEYYEAEGLMASLVDRKETAMEWARDKFVLFIGEHSPSILEGDCPSSNS